ncbi:MAG: kinase/pyrophosphorylase [Nitrospirae bacterium]|nr:MAG: kinase/pyrophosphorylase [Nitrospirota bacterium]
MALKGRRKRKVLYLVAEGTGETLRKIINASLAQFTASHLLIRSYFMVRKREEIIDIVRSASREEALLCFSIVQPELREFLLLQSQRFGLKAIDVIGDVIVQLSLFLGERPRGIPGGQYVLDEDYYRRIEAINFAVKHDDGKMPEGLMAADLILVGLSRTGKTPLSTYLAHQGWKVANVPLHPQMETPEQLFRVDQNRVFGLIIDVENLVQLRQARLKQLGLPEDSKYVDPVVVSEELQWCMELYRRHPKWHVVDVSNRAIEEIAASILKDYLKTTGHASPTELH